MQDALRVYKAGVLQALAHPTRIAILEILLPEELPTRAMQERPVEQANLSQHLAVLRSPQLVTNRDEGSQVFNSLWNPVLFEVFDIMRRYFQANVTDAIQMLRAINREATAR